MNLILGAYAASPTALSWDHAAEAEYLDRVAQLPGVTGLEAMFTGEPERDRPQLDLAVRPGWDLVLTSLLGNVARNAQDPDFGLASPVAEARRAALDLTASLRDEVRRLNDAAGRQAVLAVELYSAPSRRGTRSAFASALDVVGKWDWDGAALTVEHCDAHLPETVPQKGYLSLGDEIEVVTGNTAFAGVTINWGRSAIEGRSAATAIGHISLAVTAGALAGVMFSGAAAVPGPFGDAWLDAHLPPSAGPGLLEDGAAEAGKGGGAGGAGDMTEPTSLLGPAQIAEALAAAAGHQRFTGIKIGVRPRDMPLDRRLSYLSTAIRLVQEAGSPAGS